MRQDSSFAEVQEPHPAFVLVVRIERVGRLLADDRCHGESSRPSGANVVAFMRSAASREGL